jgi:carbamoyltransferase
MRILAISGRERDAAAAVSVEGRLVAAAAEESFTRLPGIGYRQTGGFPAEAVNACLRTASLTLDEVDRLAVVDDGPRAAPGSTPAELVAERTGHQPNEVRVDPLDADARQAAAGAPGAEAVLVFGTDPAAMGWYELVTGTWQRSTLVPGVEQLQSAARWLAGALGLADGDPFHRLDRLSLGGEAEFDREMAGAIQSSPRGVTVDEPAMRRLVERLAAGHGEALTAPASFNVRVQHLRRALAASFTLRIAHVVHSTAVDLGSATHHGSITFGGNLFAHPRLASEVNRLAGGTCALAPVPGRQGRALGAALVAAGNAGDSVPGLALGPSFSDAEIKRTLDNCRLDYVYEPDWPKLFARLSRILGQGKVVGWFQGPMAFGPRPLGTRSILCDPSNRYARHNMNEYLRQAPEDEPLPLALAPLAAGRGLSGGEAHLTAVDAAVDDAWREPLRAALDWRGHVTLNPVTPRQAPELCRLLDVHFERTGVPGLIEISLCGPGEPVACSPRDAVRTVYSSAIDALVIGQFLLMKDHWLLRSHGD